MAHSFEHQERVDGWIARSAIGASPSRLVDLLEESITVLWHRAQQSLGDVTVAAIVERVVEQAGRRHGILAALRVDQDGVSCGAMRHAVGRGENVSGELRAALRFVLVELLTVLGNLTGQILTPALHEELARVGRAQGAREQDVEGGESP